MPYKKRYTRIALSEEFCRTLEKRMGDEDYYGSLTSYIVTVLRLHLRGSKAEELPAGALVTAAKIDSKQKVIQPYERAKTG